MNEIINAQEAEIMDVQDMTIRNRLEIIEDVMRKKYLDRLTKMQIKSTRDMAPLEEDLIDNVRLYRITEMVYQ